MGEAATSPFASTSLRAAGRPEAVVPGEDLGCPSGKPIIGLYTRRESPATRNLKSRCETGIISRIRGPFDGCPLPARERLAKGVLVAPFR